MRHAQEPHRREREEQAGEGQRRLPRGAQHDREQRERGEQQRVPHAVPPGDLGQRGGQPTEEGPGRQGAHHGEGVAEGRSITEEAHEARRLGPREEVEEEPGVRARRPAGPRGRPVHRARHRAVRTRADRRLAGAEALRAAVGPAGSWAYPVAGRAAPAKSPARTHGAVVRGDRTHRESAGLRARRGLTPSGHARPPARARPELLGRAPAGARRSTRRGPRTRSRGARR